jgi:hypothetical protein
MQTAKGRVSGSGGSPFRFESQAILVNLSLATIVLRNRPSEEARRHAGSPNSSHYRLAPPSMPAATVFNLL